jgi:hypothetical protein
MDTEKIKNELLKAEEIACLTGSGDDMFYMEQVRNWFKSQDRMITHILERGYQEAQKEFSELGYSIFDGDICMDEKRFMELAKLIDSFVQDKEDKIDGIKNAFKVFSETYPTHAPALIYAFKEYLAEKVGEKVWLH